jgi:lysophospholipase L1-like esterase
MSVDLVPTAVWLASVALIWTALAVVARLSSPWAVGLTDGLFVVALLFTYAALVGAAVRGSRHRRRARLRATALTLGLLMALAALELAAALRLVHWDVLFMNLHGEGQEFVPDADLGFRHAPERRWSGWPRSDIEALSGLPRSIGAPITMTYDARGYRNPVARARADVVLIGDSFVEGRYVSDDDVLSRVLERRLGRPVANLGVAGYGAAQELIVLRKDAIPLEPAVVAWFFYEGNDLYNDQVFENATAAPREARTAQLTDAHGWWRRSLVRAGHRELRRLVQPIVPSHWPYSGTLAAGPGRGQRVLFGPEATYPWSPYEEARWTSARETLEAAARLTHEHAIHLLLVYVPIKFRVYSDFIDIAPGSALGHAASWRLHERFAELCHTAALACLDLAGPLREALRNGGQPYAPADTHWSAEGHRLVAERVADALASRGWLGPEAR